jgi:hypothetical protein
MLSSPCESGSSAKSNVICRHHDNNMGRSDSYPLRVGHQHVESCEYAAALRSEVRANDIAKGSVRVSDENGHLLHGPQQRGFVVDPAVGIALYGVSNACCLMC